MTLIQSLLGGGAAPIQQQQQQSGGLGDLIGGLLGGSGTQQTQQSQQSNGLDIGDLINAGMSFMNTKNRGGSNLEAVVNAVVSTSAMGNSGYRSQSGNLVVNALMSAISGMTRK